MDHVFLLVFHCNCPCLVPFHIGTNVHHLCTRLLKKITSFWRACLQMLFKSIVHKRAWNKANASLHLSSGCLRETCAAAYLSCAVGGLSSDSRQDVDVTEPSSALSSSLRSEPTPDRTSSMSSCETASPSAKMSLSVSLLRATRCRSRSHAFDIFLDDNSGGTGGRGDGGAGGGFASLLTDSVSAISTPVYKRADVKQRCVVTPATVDLLLYMHAVGLLTCYS